MRAHHTQGPLGRCTDELTQLLSDESSGRPVAKLKCDNTPLLFIPMKTFTLIPHSPLVLDRSMHACMDRWMGVSLFFIYASPLPSKHLRIMLLVELTSPRAPLGGCADELNHLANHPACQWQLCNRRCRAPTAILRFFTVTIRLGILSL